MALAETLKLKNFRKLYFASLTSELGSFMTETALMLAVFELSGNNKTYLGIIRAVFLASLTLGSLLGGLIGERFNRRQILILSYVCRAPLVIALIYVPQVEFIILVDGLIAFFTGIFNPARQTMINDIVPTNHMKGANSLMGSTMAILHLIGPFLGASIYAANKSMTPVLLFDFLTYVIGAGLLLQLIYSPPKKTGANQTMMNDLIQGVSYVCKDKALFSLYLNGIVAGLCIGIMFPLLLPYVKEILAAGDTIYGALLSAFGLGGLIGGNLYQRLGNRFSNGKIIVNALLAEPVVMLLWLLSASTVGAMISFFIWGVAVFIRIPAQLNYLSESVETHYLTRCYALLDMSFIIPNIGGGILVASLGDRYATDTVLYFVCGAFFLLTLPRRPFSEMKALYYSEPVQVERDTSVQDSIQH